MKDFYQVTTQPSGDTVPVTLQEAKNFLRVENTTDDTLIGGLLEAATEELEKHLNRLFITRTILGKFEVQAICTSKFEQFPFIDIRRAPVTAVNSMEVTSAGVQSAFTDFTLKETGGFPRIVFENDTPTVDPITYPIEISFDGGYGTQEDVPQPIKTAIKLLVGFWYENRGDVQPDGGLGLPVEVKAIIKGCWKFR